MNIIIFDVETNGMEGSSVLSLSALKCKINDYNEVYIIDKFNRFYFRVPGEKLNRKAIEINGLKDSMIAQLRENNNYPLYFKKDSESFKSFCGDSNHFVAHNIDFDKSFFDFELEYQFCTMKSNINILKLKWIEQYQTYKWPTLLETVNFYEISIESTKLHQSEYDTFLTFKIFSEMIKYEKTKNNIFNFLHNVI